MDNTLKKIIYRRTFLLEDLPEPLTRASEHLQFHDNYIGNTYLRLRTERRPKTREWSWLIEKNSLVTADDPLAREIEEIRLTEQEYGSLAHLEGREIRKNRYFYQKDDLKLEIDVYIGGLWGLHLANAVFDTREQAQKLKTPAFAVAEVTQNPFFLDSNLVDLTFADVQNEFVRMTATV